jgi:hypothetical protein
MYRPVEAIHPMQHIVDERGRFSISRIGDTLDPESVPGAESALNTTSERE